MRTQLQTDPRWANETIGHTNLTIKDYGCFITSLGNLSDRTPSEVNKILTDGGVINSKGLITDKIRAAQLLGLDYNGISDRKPDYDTIIETDYYDKKPTPAKEQHFLNIKADGARIDTLPNTNPNKYRIVSYRLFEAKEKEIYMDEETANHMRRHLVFLVWPIILGRPADEKTIQENADWIKRDSEGSFNYKGMAEWVANLYNCPEAVEYRKKQCITSDDKYVTAITSIKNIIGGL
jgi:hypothetical protein